MLAGLFSDLDVVEFDPQTGFDEKPSNYGCTNEIASQLSHKVFSEFSEESLFRDS